MNAHRITAHYLLILALLSTLSGCAHLRSPHMGTIIIQKNLFKTHENGEKLAKPMPKKSILVHSPLNIAIAMTDMGIAMALGMQQKETKDIIAAIDPIPPFNIENSVEDELSRKPLTTEFEYFLKQRHQNEETIIIEPYLFLNSYSNNAYVEVRIPITIKSKDSDDIFQKLYCWKSANAPLTGKKSFIENNGKKIAEAFKEGLPLVIKSIQEQLPQDIDKEKTPHQCVEPG